MRESRQYVTGEMLVFDYTLDHYVINDGPRERIVLLMLLGNRMESSRGAETVLTQDSVLCGVD